MYNTSRMRPVPITLALARSIWITAPTPTITTLRVLIRRYSAPSLRFLASQRVNMWHRSEFYGCIAFYFLCVAHLVLYLMSTSQSIQGLTFFFTTSQHSPYDAYYFFICYADNSTTHSAPAGLTLIRPMRWISASISTLTTSPTTARQVQAEKCYRIVCICVILLEDQII